MLIRLFLTAILVPASFCSAQGSSGVPPYPPYTCTTTTTRCKTGDGPVEQLLPPSPAVVRAKHGPRGQKGEKGEPCQCDVMNNQEVTQVANELQNMKREFEEMKQSYRRISEAMIKYPTSCEEYATYQGILGKEFVNKSIIEIYPLMYGGDLTPVSVACDPANQETWIVIQRRMDGSVDFYRGWQSYVEGFGDPTSEFWIGLRTLHKLTVSREYQLRVELRNWADESKYAVYSTFRVGDSESKFQLTVGGYSGTAGDGLAYHNGHDFTTYDSDNDGYNANCAVVYSSAWWHSSCFKSNLNGIYRESSDNPGSKGISWTPWMGQEYALPFVEMKIKLM